jgi:hypothetical protein
MQHNNIGPGIPICLPDTCDSFLQVDVLERRVERQGADGQLALVLVLEPGDEPQQKPVPPVLDDEVFLRGI